MDDSSDLEGRAASEEDELHDSDESDSEESINAGALLDLEAVESGDEDEDEDGDDGDEGSTESHDSYHHSFSQFCRLPIELRRRVWEFFDPSLRSPARVFNVLSLSDCIWPSAILDQQTAPARAVLGVNRESRHMALNFYPNTLPLHPNLKGVLRFHGEQDIVLFESMASAPVFTTIADALQQVRHIAVEFRAEDLPLEQTVDLPSQIFPGLRALYMCWGAHEISSHDLRWCVSDSVHTFFLETKEEEPGLGEDISRIYCWPNLEDHLEYAEKEIHQNLRLGQMTGAPFGPGVNFWPLVEFSWSRGARQYYRLQEKVLAGPDVNWESDSSDPDEGSSELDEYESDGIDDATIDESDDADDSDNDLVVRDASEEDADNASSFEGFSPQSKTASFSGDAEPVAQFSSLEPESPRDCSPGDSESDKEPVPKSKRSRRRQVVSSDSEDGSATEAVNKTKRQLHQTSRRSGRVVLSDSEDSDEAKVSGVATQSKDVESAESAESDDTADEQSEEESNEEQGNKKPMSLAERLQLYRSDNPVPEDGSDSAESEAFYRDAEEEHDLIEGGAYGEEEEVSENDRILDMPEEELDDDDEAW